jgi:HD superfamily phosphohydrolase
VYPGATHSRFAHALGALHLTTTAIETLKAKDIDITEQEYLGVCIAILLHDIGHGPYSHALEEIFLPISHEEITVAIMKRLNIEFNGQLTTALQIFQNNYPKKFLTQLVSSQLDMDRMDYLMRDSFYSGVAEGIIGYKRIISMLSVVDNQLVIEEKGIYSVQKFLVSRHIMYLQVYLHKNSIVAEQMLKSFVHRLKYLVNNGAYPLHNSKIERLLTDNQIFNKDFDQNLKTFTTLDDVDVMFTIKNSIDSADQILEAYARGLLNRSLFKVLLSKKPFDSDLLTDLRQNVKIQYSVSDLELDQLIISGKETTRAYDTKVNEIKILMKSGEVRPISDCLDTLVNMEDITQYYLCYPK